jgi:hypothetical protein
MRKGIFLVAALLFVAWPARPTRAADVDKLLPNDCECVLTVNVTQLLGSALNKKHGLLKMEELLQSNEGIQDHLKSLGFDPLKDITSVAWASANTGDPGKALIIIHGKFDPKKFEAKADEVVQTYGDVLKIHKVGPSRLYEVSIPGQSPYFVAVVDSGTIVASAGQEYMVEALNKAAGTKKPEVKKELVDLVKKVEAERTLWLVALKSALEHSPLSADDNARPVLAKIETGYLGVSVSQDLKAEFDLTTKDAETTKELNKELLDKLDKAKGIVSILVGNVKELQILLDLAEAMKVTSQGNTVSLRGQIGPEAIEKSLKE